MRRWWLGTEQLTSLTRSNDDPAGNSLRFAQKKNYWFRNWKIHIDGLVQERRSSSALAMELRLSCTNPSICCGISREICPPLDVTPNSCLLSRLTAVVQLTLTRWLPHCVDADRNSRSVNTWQEIPQVKRLIWINTTGGNSWFASWTKWPASRRRFPNEISLKSKCHIKGPHMSSQHWVG